MAVEMKNVGSLLVKWVCHVEKRSLCWGKLSTAFCDLRNSV